MLITKEYQVTIYCNSNQYKPISTIVVMKQEDDINWTLLKDKREAIKKKGIQAICLKRGWSKRDLVNNNYTKIKIRMKEEK